MHPRPRSTPTETLENLRPPLSGFPYFANAGAFPFQPRAAADSPVNAWWLADASFLAYGDAAFVEAAVKNSPLPALGYQLDWIGTRGDNRGIALSHPESLILVFRGTRVDVHSILDKSEILVLNQDDLLTDSLFFPVEHRTGGLVHAGFLKAFRDVQERVDALAAARRPEQALWLAGHSLGGALATLAAAHFGPEAVQGLYTYGCPRVGNAAFGRTLPDRNYLRYVHRDDFVPTVPPPFLGFVHAGKPKPVPGSPPRNPLTDLLSGASELATVLGNAARDFRFPMGDLPFKVAGLSDHAPVYYASYLWNALL